MYIDTHCHLNFKDYKDDYREVAQRAFDAQVEMIVVGSEFKTSQRAVSLAQEFDQGVFAAIGLHPIHLQDILVKNNNNDNKYEFRSRREEYRESNYSSLIATGKKIVAVGEIGLDYYHINASSDQEAMNVKKMQQEVFYKQLELAKKNNLPVIIHCREAHDDLYAVLKEFAAKNSFDREWGVVHCFSGDLEQAKKYWDLGLLISFTGLITFVRDWDELIRKAPIEKMMIETDAPYLTPTPYRGQRNEPAHVREVARRMAEIRGIDLELLSTKIQETSRSFFNI